MVKSPTGYRTGHFPEIRPDTGPDLLSGTPLYIMHYHECSFHEQSMPDNQRKFELFDLRTNVDHKVFLIIRNTSGLIILKV